DSRHAASGSPTMVNPGRPVETWTSTMTGRPSTPNRVADGMVAITAAASTGTAVNRRAGPAAGHARRARKSTEGVRQRRPPSHSEHARYRKPPCHMLKASVRIPQPPQPPQPLPQRRSERPFEDLHDAPQHGRDV